MATAPANRKVLLAPYRAQAPKVNHNPYSPSHHGLTPLPERFPRLICYEGRRPMRHPSAIRTHCSDQTPDFVRTLHWVPFLHSPHRQPNPTPRVRIYFVAKPCTTARTVYPASPVKHAHSVHDRPASPDRKSLNPQAEQPNWLRSLSRATASPVHNSAQWRQRRQLASYNRPPRTAIPYTQG